MKSNNEFDNFAVTYYGGTESSSEISNSNGNTSISSGGVETGDRNEILCWAAALVVSAAGTGLFAVRRKRVQK